MPYRDFDAFLKEQSGESITFDFLGKNYAAPGQMPAMLALKIAALRTPDVDLSKEIPEGWVLALLSRILKKSDIEQMAADGAGMDDLGGLLDWLMGIYNGKPDENPQKAEAPAA